MARVVVYPVSVCFGDCDPAGIVFFPNFSRWMDAASLNFFVACGIPIWRELVKTHGIIGTPLLEINTKFFQPATYGETVEVRAFCIKDPDQSGRIKAIPVPAFIREACS